MKKPKDNTSASTNFQFNVSKSTLFKKDARNYINVVGEEQLNSLEKTSLLDIHLSKNNIVEPHYHQHASELIYCISGAIIIGMMNPKTKKFHSYQANSAQVINIPQGWWHYIIATADNTHILGIFDEAQPQVILGSDILKGTPSNVMAHTYCLNEQQWKETIRPIEPSTFIGPTKNCEADTLPPKKKQESHPQQKYKHGKQMQPYTKWRANYPSPNEH